MEKNYEGLYKRLRGRKMEKEEKKEENSFYSELIDCLKGLEKIPTNYEGLLSELRRNKGKYDIIWMAGKNILENEAIPKVLDHNDKLGRLRSDYLNAMESRQTEKTEELGQGIVQENEAFSQAVATYETLEAKIKFSRGMAIMHSTLIDLVIIIKDQYQGCFLDLKKAMAYLGGGKN